MSRHIEQKCAKCGDGHHEGACLRVRWGGSFAAPVGSAATITGLQALLHCELWTRSDMNMAEDKRAYEHRLNVIRQGIAQLEGKQPNDQAEPLPPDSERGRHSRP